MKNEKLIFAFEKDGRTFSGVWIPGVGGKGRVWKSNVTG